MPRTRKVKRAKSPVPMIDQVRAVLEKKNLHAEDVMRSLCTSANGSRTRGSKLIGKFRFVCERNHIDRGVFGPSMYLYAYPKDGSERDRIMVAAGEDAV